MSNFDFVKAEWPAIHGDCVLAQRIFEARLGLVTALDAGAVEA